MSAQQTRVLHFIDSGGVYGAERVILGLSRELASDSVYEPIVGCIVHSRSDSNDLYDAAIAEGISAVKIPIRNHLLVPDLPRAARMMRSMNVRLIHTHGYKPSVFAGVIRAMTGIPAIATCHLWFRPEVAPFKTRVMIGLERRMYRHFPAVVAVSDPIRQILLAHGVPANRAHLIRNGIYTKFGKLEGTERLRMRAELGIPEDALCVINTARLTTQKAQWALVEAAAELRHRKASISILIVGEGELQQELRELVICRNLSGIVQLLGFRTDIKELLSIADIFALPSLDEGMPMSLLEAISANLPVIVTPVGDIPKLIESGRSGIFVPPADPAALTDAITYLQEHPIEARAMAQQAHANLLAEYSSHAMAASYVEVYRSILGQSS